MMSYLWRRMGWKGAPQLLWLCDVLLAMTIGAVIVKWVLSTAVKSVS